MLLHLGRRRARSAQERSQMPHNMFFGLSNYVSLAIVIVIVLVVVAIWWLRTQGK